ncbi:MAG: AI-2E family transporter [Rudaea sp.]
MTVDHNDEPQASPGAAAQNGDGAQQLALWRNRLLTMILSLLVLYACTAASRLLVPILVAILLSLMLAPAVRWLTRWYLPRALASLLVLMGAIALGGLLLNMLVAPARQWVAHAPQALEQISRHLHDLWRPIANATKATEQITNLAQMSNDSHTVKVVESSQSNPLSHLLTATPAVFMSIVTTLLLVFVFLLHGDAVLRKLVEFAPHWHAKREVVVATRDAQRELSAYVLTISLINAGLGLATATALWCLGVPDPLLWGGVAALFNFAPYIGPLMTVITLTLVGMGHAKPLLLSLAPPCAFLLLHLLESLILTPLLAGRRLALDPIMIFLSLMLLGWMWGVAGLLIAVPLLTCIKIVAARVPRWAPLAKLLGA